MLRRDHGRAAQALLDRSDQLLRLGAYGIRKRSLHGFGVRRAHLRDDIAVFRFFDVAVFDELAQAVGVIEISDPVVALAEAPQRLAVDCAGQTAQHEEDEDLDIEALVNKAEMIHVPAPVLMMLWI